MTVNTQKRQRVPVGDLVSGIPSFPVFEGEDKLDVAKEASTFLVEFADAIQEGKWDAFGELLAEDCWWKDSLTLTFDKRTLRTRPAIVEAWKTLSSTRQPSSFTSEMDDAVAMKAQFVRMAPTMAMLDVPFSFYTDAPKSKCIGQAKLILQDNKWKIWILATAVVSLTEHPFATLPRQTPSMIDVSQRGKSQAQGFPRVQGVLDAIVIGGGCSGIANTTMLDAIGANVVAFEKEEVAGGNWSTQRYDNVTLHHPAFMIQLPQYPVPDGYPNFLTGRDLTRYFSSAVETLQLPYFAGIKVISNIFDKSTAQWRARIQDVKTGDKTILEAKNIVMSTGFIVSPDNPNIPDVTDQNLFKGPVQHTTEYRTPEPYKGKDVIVVGSGNSAHDVARSLALGGAKDVTILQRSPTVLLDFEVILPVVTINYQGNHPIDASDFLQSAMPTGIMRDMARGGLAMLIQSQAERYAAFESKGYLVDRTPCLISRGLEEYGRSFYMDQPKTFDLVFNDRIKIARGEARGFVEGGLVVHDKAEGKDKTLNADGVIFATGYKPYDLPKKWAETGFVDAESAAGLENVSLFGVDEEGETPGYVTFSGHSHLYFSGIGFFMSRWVGTYTAIQIMADIRGKFPVRYPRSSS